MSSGLPRERVRLAAVAAVCVAAALPYLPSLSFYFVADDFGVVQLLSGKPAFYFPRWFYTSWMDTIWGMNADEVRPFPALTYQIASWFGAGSPVADHIFNIGFHAGSGLLVLALARRVAGLDLAPATFAALVFVLLPVHAETVAWITGRVDSIPTLFYLATYLAYASWRRRPSRPGLYVWALVWFLLALYSKQNTITMVATLVLHDLLVERRRPGLSWDWVRPYVPFAAMTAAYLALRYALFGELAREGHLTGEQLGFFGGQFVRHAGRVIAGDPAAGNLALLVAFGVLAATWTLGRWQPDRAPRPLEGLLLFFGPAWWIIGVAPIAVATYESPRHVYLAAAGWAILLGILVQVLTPPAGSRRQSTRPVRAALAAACAAVLIAYTIGLARAVEEWGDRALISRRMVEALEATALRAPPGSLILVGVPPASWEWSLPFAAQQPFASGDLTGRVRIVSPQRLHCCRAQWADHTRAVLMDWLREEPALPVIGLRWDERSGSIIRRSDDEVPGLRALVATLPGTDTAHALDQSIRELLARVIVPASP